MIPSKGLTEATKILSRKIYNHPEFQIIPPKNFPRICCQRLKNIWGNKVSIVSGNRKKKLTSTSTIEISDTEYKTTVLLIFQKKIKEQKNVCRIYFFKWWYNKFEKKNNLKLKLAAMDKKYLKLKTQWMKVTLDKIR